MKPCWGQVSIFLDGSEQSTQITTNQEAANIAQRQLNELIRAGYLFASIDSIAELDSVSRIYIHKGEKVRMIIDSVNMQLEPFDRFNRFDGSSSNEILKDFSSHGYPFIRLSWSDMKQDKRERIHAVLNIDPGPFIVNDTLVVLNPVKTKRRFIQRSIDLVVGEPYNELAYQNVAEKLKRIPFIELKSAPDIAFSAGKATTYLNLEEKTSSSFEGILGLLPNQRANGNLLLTGYLDLSLGNLFATGKQLSFNWQQFAVQSQQLSIAYDHPYLLGSNVLLGAGFKLLKQDSTFITRDVNLHIGTYLWEYVRFDGSYSRFESDVVTPEVESASNELLADYTTDLYALQISREQSSNTFGSYWNYSAQMTFGRKKINRNPAFPVAFYDSIATISTVYRLDIHSRWQNILFGQTALFLQNDLGLLENEQIVRNELYRMGGLKSLRGFNENFLFVQNYLLNKVELRQYFEQNSFLTVFYDQLIYNNFSQWRYPFGLGVGFSLATSNGLFSFAFALGSSSESQFDVNNTKIHLGYTSKF